MIEIQGLAWETAIRRLHGLTGTLTECQLPYFDERGIILRSDYSFGLGTDRVASFSNNLESKSFEVDPFFRLCTEVGSGNGRKDPKPRLISVRLLVGQEAKMRGILRDKPGFQVATEVFSVQFLFGKVDGETQVNKSCKLFNCIEVEDDAQIPLHILPEIPHEWLHQVAQVGFPA